MSTQDCMYGTEGGQSDPAVLSLQLLANLTSTQAGVLLPQVHNELLDLEG
jgi:hypothetical protein